MKHVGILAAESPASAANFGGSPSSAGTGQRKRRAANKIWRTRSTVPAASVVHESARLPSVSSADAAVATAAST